MNIATLLLILFCWLSKQDTTEMRIKMFKPKPGTRRKTLEEAHRLRKRETSHRDEEVAFMSDSV